MNRIGSQLSIAVQHSVTQTTISKILKNFDFLPVQMFEVILSFVQTIRIACIGKLGIQCNSSNLINAGTNRPLFHNDRFDPKLPLMSNYIANNRFCDILATVKQFHCVDISVPSTNLMLSIHLIRVFIHSSKYLSIVQNAFFFFYVNNYVMLYHHIVEC